MTWPQIVVALWLLCSGVLGVVGFARDRDLEYPTTIIIFHVGIRVGLAFVLSAGGFW